MVQNTHAEEITVKSAINVAMCVMYIARLLPIPHPPAVWV